MPSRREFLRDMFLSLGLLSASGSVALAEKPRVFQGTQKFDLILAKAKAGNWKALPIGELMGKIAMELKGTPYKGGTLELSPDRETCSVNLLGLDCVTFFELTLDLARMIKKGGHTPADLLAEVSHTRYRGGVPGDYSTRLHYTTDWFVDNQAKHVVQLLSHLPGAEPFPQKVGFMTSHPKSYPSFGKHPELIAQMQQIEAAINSRSLNFIPLDKLAAIEPILKTGDIVGVCTNMPGLDIAHTGLVLRTADGVAHFMDASSKKSTMRVVIEPGPISQVLNWSKNLTGAMFARPLEPRI